MSIEERAEAERNIAVVRDLQEREGDRAEPGAPYGGIFVGPARLREVMLEREAALKDRLVEKYWREDNPLLSIHHAGEQRGPASR